MNTTEFDKVLSNLMWLRSHPVDTKQTYTFMRDGKKYTIKAESYAVAWLILNKISK